jgi:outer membrane protein assembly factor BamB
MVHRPIPAVIPVAIPVAVLAAILVSCLSVSLVGQGDWNQFRGPGGTGIAAGTKKLPVKFGPNDYLNWKCDVGAGHSSPCIRGELVFLTTSAGKKLETWCIDRKTGEVRWRRAVTANVIERHHRINSPASSTPTADGERVYVCFGSFGLLCYDFAGAELWRREVEPARNMFGTAASPIVFDKLLIWNRDNRTGSNLEAIRGATGETVWRTDRGSFGSGWSTPTVWRNGDVDELLIYGVFQLTAYDVRTGKERWSVPGLADEPCITPVTGEGLVFVSSYNMRINPEVIGLPTFERLREDYDTDGNGKLNREEAKKNKSVLSRADADGEGDHPLSMFFRFLDKDRDGEIGATEWKKMSSWLGGFKHANALVAIRPGDGEKKSAEIAWQHGRGVPECPSPLYHDGRVYLVKNAGIATCLDAKTGELAYQERIGSRGPCYASPVVGDGKIYTASARGVITVFAVGDELKVLARNDLKERIMATPALVDGTIYVRTEKHLFAFGGS